MRHNELGLSFSLPFFPLFVLDNPKWDLTFEGTYTQTYATVRHIMLKNELRMDKEKRLLNA